MENSGAEQNEERIAALEQKCREMDSLIKGLLDELLDLKSISMKLSRQIGEYRYHEPGRETVSPGTAPPGYAEPGRDSPAASPSADSVVVRPKGESRPDVPVAPPEPAMVRIMQSDGTFKMEPRRGSEKPIDSSGGYGQNRKSTLSGSKRAR